MAKKIPTGREIHFSPEQCELLYGLLNNVKADGAGGLRYAIALTDLIKAVGAERAQNKLDERDKFARSYMRVGGGKESNEARKKINDELQEWLEEHELTNECFSTKPETIAVTIPPESNTVILNTLLFHSRIQVGSGLVKIVELCDKFELRTEFTASAVKLDADDKKAKEKKQ